MTAEISEAELRLRKVGRVLLERVGNGFIAKNGDGEWRGLVHQDDVLVFASASDMTRFVAHWTEDPKGKPDA